MADSSGPILVTDYLVKSTELKSVADAIRAKSGTSESLVWPDGYKAAVEAINAKSILRVKTGTFTLAEDAQAPEVIHNLGVIPDLIIVEAADHDNTAYSILGFVAVRPGFLSFSKFVGMILINKIDGMEGSAMANVNGETAFNNGLSASGFVCAYNSANYKYRAGWTYKWKVFAGLTWEDA